MDSISLGQLRAIAPQNPKPKQASYDFRYDDEDTTFNEIEEFYSYAELPQIDENYRAWQGSFPSDWNAAPPDKKRSHIALLLETLEHKDSEVRFTNARRLLYLLQGAFAESSSPEHQLYCIVENAKAFRAANGVSIVRDALKIANAKHDLLHSWSDVDTANFNISPQDKADFIEEVCTEISIYLGMLYHVIQVLKGDMDFADELSEASSFACPVHADEDPRQVTLGPPLPVFLFNLVASLKDKSPKGYPVKKLVLTVWKCLIACLGGLRELPKVKSLTRELAQLHSPASSSFPIKSSPADVSVFRHETFAKYPTFTPPSPKQSSILAGFDSRLAEIDQPLPVRNHYHHHYDSSGHTTQTSNSQPQNGHSSFQNRGLPIPGTPLPTPPPSPKPKKQQFQTDQTRPFLFPYSSLSGTGNTGKVPFAVEEADRLYGRHMHVSVSMWQTWRIRDECIREEAGLNVPEKEHEIHSDQSVISDNLRDVEDKIQKLSATRNWNEHFKLKERRDNLLRLSRVEHIYNSLLPNLNSCINQLLKMLLATVTAATAPGQNPVSATSATFPPNAPVDPGPPAEPLSLEEMDVTRHREITSKAVSAILLLLLKWFKASHVMKFHHLGLLLLDSNCLLLILKMFGLQEVSHVVMSKCDSPDHNFFRYCFLRYSPSPHSAPLEMNPKMPARQTIARISVLPNGDRIEEEIELITDFSWRNFYSSINFVKVMQKLTKGRSHRIWLLVQYKSSAILKRALKVPHNMLQLQILKLIKSQVPHCGRKWRQSNMKVITQIYMNCRPDLRDEWLTGSEIEDISDVMGQEQTLRSLVKFYNLSRYGPVAYQGVTMSHKRNSSLSAPGLDGLYVGSDMLNVHRGTGTPNLEIDVFPPLRSHAPDPSIFLPYIPEDIAFEEEYEEYLSDLGLSEVQTSKPEFKEGATSEFGHAAWSKLFRLPNMADNISDSESVMSIGDLNDEVRAPDQPPRDENVNDWVHMSPKTMAALPKSPAGGNRRASSGAQLRPVLPFDLDEEGSAVDDVDADDMDTEMGPMPIEGAGFGAGEGGRGVDEVEFMYHE